MNSPCENCTRIKIPETCDKKTCPEWRVDFTKRWDETCLNLFRLLNKKGKKRDTDKSV